LALPLAPVVTRRKEGPTLRAGASERLAIFGKRIARPGKFGQDEEALTL
jgi:hypothetical protein